MKNTTAAHQPLSLYLHLFGVYTLVLNMNEWWWFSYNENCGKWNDTRTLCRLIQLSWGYGLWGRNEMMSMSVYVLITENCMFYALPSTVHTWTDEKCIHSVAVLYYTVLCSCCILNDEKSLSYNIRIEMKNMKNNKNEVKQPN